MNLKEGSGGTAPEFARYIRIAIGSKEEVQYQLLLARDLRYIKQDEWKQLTDELSEVGKMLYALLNKLV